MTTILLWFLYVLLRRIVNFQGERDEWVSSIKQSLGRDPLYDYIADKRRRATIRHQQNQEKNHS